MLAVNSISQVLNQEDPSWWQAKVLESSYSLPSEAQTGLVPSQTLQVSLLSDRCRRAFLMFLILKVSGSLFHVFILPI